MVKNKWIQNYITEDQIEKIEAKIADIENVCDVEIIPVVVKASSNYPQTQVTLFLLLTSLALPFLIFFKSDIYWSSKPSVFPFGNFGISIAVYFILAALIPYLSKSGFLKRYLSHRRLEDEQCQKRAELEFYREKLQSSEKRNGLLVFISMLEHRVILRSDKNLHETIQSDKILKDSLSLIVKSLKKKELGQGLMLALESIELELKTKAPLTSPPKNLLPNKLVIKE